MAMLCPHDIPVSGQTVLTRGILRVPGLKFMGHQMLVWGYQTPMLLFL